MDILVLIFIALLFVWFTISTFILFYNRYLRTYKPEIREYLKLKGFEYVETIDPQKEDWAGSPFDKPASFAIGFYTRGVTWTKYEYLIAIGVKHQKYQQFWIELKTSYFQKPKLVFRDGKRINYSQLSNSENFLENCPSCGFVLFNNDDKKCPNCGYELVQRHPND